MASFIRNKNYLKVTGSSLVSFLPKSAPGSIALVSFYRYVSNQISAKPSSSICAGYQYVVAVTRNSQTFYLTPGPNPTTFNLSCSLSDPVLFSPASKLTQIVLNQLFGGVLIISGKQESGDFVIKRNNNFKAAGYDSPLPTLLNNCAECPCSNGYSCQKTGVCAMAPAPCPSDAVCGQGGGQCFGTCSTSTPTKCQKVSGRWTCVPNNSLASWTILFWVLLIFVVVGIFLFFFIYAIAKEANPPIYEVDYVETGSPIPVQISQTTVDQNIVKTDNVVQWYQEITPVITEV